MELSHLISQNLITDTLLNLVGYLLAGALWMILYMAIAGRRKPATATAGAQSDRAAQNATPGRSSGRRIEFVSLASEQDPVKLSIAAATRGETQQRNRAEVIRLAREMLHSGTPKENVRSLLPISEGELAMLLDKQRA